MPYVIQAWQESSSSFRRSEATRNGRKMANLLSFAGDRICVE